GFGILHAYGLCYKDIKHDNLFIDFESGKVLICDNDNVVPDKSDIGQIAGTIRFMAPEIVLCEEKPSTNTDLFSLAVLLFYLFNIHHPLEGRNEAEIKALDLPAMNYLYGKNPVFIWDPENDENRPVSFYQQNAIDFWNVYPDFFKEVFIRVFTKGLKNPKERITEKEWEYFCLKLLDSIILCANNKCQAENFYDFSKSNQSCWACGQVLPKPLCLEIDQDKLILNCNSFVLQHHIKGDFCIENEVGMVVKHPQTPNLWGIKNISKDIWTYTFPNGDTSTIPTGKAFPLKYGGKINFGKRNGTIV
ncbi:MAG: serine/threonine protein kinase, partial [Bacteroidetes bacterium]|nr:serine/threonine protein kinase [Bacteroidota bacterium]